MLLIFIGSFFFFYFNSSSSACKVEAEVGGRARQSSVEVGCCAHRRGCGDRGVMEALARGRGTVEADAMRPAVLILAGRRVEAAALVGREADGYALKRRGGAMRGESWWFRKDEQDRGWG